MTITTQFTITLSVDKKYDHLWNPSPVVRKTVTGTLDRETAAKQLREAFERMLAEVGQEQRRKRS